MKKKDKYLKVVEWSEEDGCYVGTAPGLVIGGVHGKDPKKVFAHLCDVVDESVKLLEKEGRPLPEATAGKNFSGKILLRIPPELHRGLAVKALQEGESVNRYIQQQLQASL